MRIVAGKFKGRILRSFSCRGIRPTSDRLRETLFDVLQAEIDSSVVWDAFAGTGALGLEAISRGARRVVFTERSRQALKVLQENVSLLDVADAVEIIQADAVTWVAHAGHRFDLVFLDPPYGFKRYVDLFVIMAGRQVCRPQGKVVLEHHKRSPSVAGLLELFAPDRQVRQGDSVLSFFSGEALILGKSRI